MNMSAALETPNRSIGQRLPTHILEFVRDHLLLFSLVIGVSMFGALSAKGQSGASLSGKVSDPSGAGMSGALVILYSPDRVLPTKCDLNGRFEFAHVPPGKYTLETSSKGFKPKAIEVVVLKEKTIEPLLITLNVGSMGCDSDMLNAVAYEQAVAGSPALFGIVHDLDEHHAPLSMVKLIISKVGETRVLAEQNTNDKGEFQFTDLKPGKYALRASREGYTDVPPVSFWVTRENRTRLTIGMLEKGKMIVCG